jgi:chromosomal replication initiation ATPase DnaA
VTELQATLVALSLQRNSVVNAIVRDAALAFGIAPEAILSRDRSKSISEARAMVCYVARRCTRMSFTEIGRALGIDQSSVNSAFRRVRRLRASDAWLDAAARLLLESFGGETEESRAQ